MALRMELGSREGGVGDGLAHHCRLGLCVIKSCQLYANDVSDAA